MDDPIRLANEPRRRRTPLERMETGLVRALEEGGLLAPPLLAEARAADPELRLSTRLWSLGIVTEDELRCAFASFLRVPCASIEAIRAGAHELAGRIREEDAVRARVVPVATREGRLMAATAEPWRLALLEDLGERIGRTVIACFLDEAPLARLLEDVYGLRADERFTRTPELRTRALVRDAAGAGAEDDAEPAAELMSETWFDRMYHR